MIRATRTPRRILTMVLVSLGLVPAQLSAVIVSHRMTPQGLKIHGVGPDSPILYDNDWWFDVFDNNYLWAQVSLGKADLHGNIVTRDMWDWQKGYHYKMEQCVDDAKKALKLARDSGLRNIPDLTLGSDSRASTAGQWQNRGHCRPGNAGQPLDRG